MGDAEIKASSWYLVEVGRVARFAKGPNAGKLAAIVQIIDHRRVRGCPRKSGDMIQEEGIEDMRTWTLTNAKVLVEGPSSDESLAVPRHAAPLSALSLTSIVIPKLPLAVGSPALKKKWDAHEVDSKWANSATAKTAAKLARRKQLSDFERFKVMVLRKNARFEVRKAQATAKAGKA
jgi:large subunit ribosomal protein L14e